MKLTRISRDGTLGIVHDGSSFSVMELSSGTIASSGTSFRELSANNSWRRPLASEVSTFSGIDEDVELNREENDGSSAGDYSPPVREPEAQEVYEFNEEFDFFAVPTDDNEHVNDIYSVDPETEELYHWVNGEFTPVGESEDGSDINESPWILVDSITAEHVADWMDHSPEEEVSYYIFTGVENEKEMFDVASSEIDWEFIEELGSVVADASGYSPAERARNATRQRRGPGGRFATMPGGSGSGRKATSIPQPVNAETRNSEVLKTYIPTEIEIVRIDNPVNFIADFLQAASPTAGDAGLTADAAPEQEVLPDVKSEVMDEEVTTSPDAVYFAIVHKDDAQAVQDVVAITKAESGAPQVWRRNAGEWILAPELLTQLQSATPPPIVQLEDEALKTVMAGIDEYDAGQGPAEEAPVQASAMAQMTSRGYSLANGSLMIRNVNDLVATVKMVPEDSTFEVKSHIVKRARALNRMDVVPEEWRALPVFSQEPLFNTYGEVLVAAGKHRGGNEETLKSYWAEGEGAARIKWNTDGDLTRCHSHLTKFLGSEDAWGYCQNLHQRKYGISNYKKDNG